MRSRVESVLIDSESLRFLEADARGLEVWKSRGRWFWANKDSLKIATFGMTSDHLVDPSPVRGPFDTASAALDSALAGEKIAA